MQQFCEAIGCQDAAELSLLVSLSIDLFGNCFFVPQIGNKSILCLLKGLSVEVKYVSCGISLELTQPEMCK